MEILEAINVVKNSNVKKFTIKYDDGSKKIIRIFMYGSETLCEYKRNSTKWGYPIPNNEICKWVSITPVNSAETHIKVKRFMINVVKYLNKSGLWDEIRTDFEKILSQGDDYLKHVLSLEWSEQREYLRNTIDASFHVDSIVRSALKGIVSINYDSYNRDYIRKRANESIIKNEQYSFSWRKGYDNSVEFRTCSDGTKKGWYSEEYKNCGNGHYYLALDERRAIFCEDD